MNYLRENGIKLRLLLPLSLMLITSLLVFIYGFSHEEKSHIEEDFQRSALSTQRNYDSALRAEVKTLAAALEFLQNDETLRHSLISRDREGALHYAAPIFERLRSQFLITHFYLLTPERQVLLRAHQPSRHDDIINRYTAIQAEKTGRPASGIELGTLGTFTLRVVYPIYASNDLIGYIELGEEIEHVVENVLTSIGVELAIAIDKRLLSRDEWEQGMKMLGHQNRWELLPSFAETYSSIKIPTETQKQILHNTSTQNKAERYDIDNKYFFAVSRPLTDANKQEVGRLIIMRDMTERIINNDKAILNISLLAFMIGAFVLVFFYFLAGRIERRLEISHKKLIQAKNHAEKANSVKSEFLSCMSHELRTPLNIIIGYAQILEREKDSISADQHNSVSNILTSGNQMLSLVDDLLEFSSIDGRKLNPDIQPLKIKDFVSTCVNQITIAMAYKKHVIFENKVDNHMVLGDQRRLKQVLINLLSNAIKYNKENGQVIISSIIETTGRLKIKVHDTGHGIASDKLSFLFTRFERLDQKNGAIPGAGIGLYISKQLVEAMHGTVGAESVLGEGSTFWFDLPLAEDTQP